MLQKRPILIWRRGGGEIWSQSSAADSTIASLAPHPSSATVAINLHFTPAFILPLLFVIFGEGSSLLALLETYFIAEEKGTIQVFISD